MNIQWQKTKNGRTFKWQAEGKNWFAWVRIPWNEDFKYTWEFTIYGKDWTSETKGQPTNHSKKARRQCEEFMKTAKGLIP